MATVNNTNNYGTSRYIVNSTAGLGNYTTIASAITQASADGGGDIFIMPGTYTENLTMVAGVNLVSNTASSTDPSTIIVGKITCNYVGSCSISGICLQTNSDYCITSTTTQATVLNLENCLINCANNVGMFSNNSSFKMRIYECTAKSTGNIALYTFTSISEADLVACDFQLGSSVSNFSNVGAGGLVRYLACKTNYPVSTTSSGIIDLNNTYMDSNSANSIFVQTAGTATSYITNSKIVSGTASAVKVGSGTTCIMNYVSISSSNSKQITS